MSEIQVVTTDLYSGSNTFRSTGPHLHLEFREPKLDNGGGYVEDTTGFVYNNFNPIDYLKKHGIEF